MSRVSNFVNKELNTVPWPLSHPLCPVMSLHPSFERLFNKDLAILISPQCKIFYLITSRSLQLLKQPIRGQYSAGIWWDMNTCTNGENFWRAFENGDL